MYENIGGKIKTLAVVITVIGIFCSFVIGVVAIAAGDDMIPLGLMIIIFGSVMSWISSFVLYGFGELIARVYSIDSKLSGISGGAAPHGSLSAKLDHITEKMRDIPAAVNKAPTIQDMQQLKMLFLNGKITEEEYYSLLNSVRNDSSQEPGSD